MRSLSASVALALLVASGPARACLALVLPQAVLFDRPPSHRPPGYRVIRVVGSQVESDREHLLVTLLDPVDRRRLGTRAWVRPGPATSCTGWGRLGSEAYLVARPVDTLRGRTVLLAAVYDRSRWDLFWHRFGWVRYRARGQAVPLHR